MVELPAVIEIIDELAAESDFFSIGTNDFIQYMLAVDRTNEKVAEFFLPHHPSILRALHKIVRAASRHHKEVSICGDMIHEVRYLSYFLGIGIRKMSIDPRHFLRIQQTIAQIDIREAEAQAGMLLKKSTVQDITNVFYEKG
jgi:phosphotransferase system, enzyme I, PtsP